MELVFPETEYRLRDLPAPEHAIWRTELPVPAQFARRHESCGPGANDARVQDRHRAWIVACGGNERRGF